jgi:hypothetical protein
MSKKVYLVFQATESLLLQTHLAKVRPLPSKAFDEIGLKPKDIYRMEFDMYYGDYVETYILASNATNKQLAFMPRKQMRDWLKENIQYGEFYYVLPEIIGDELVSLRIYPRKDVDFQIEITLKNAPNLHFVQYFHAEQAYFGIIKN